MDNYGLLKNPNNIINLAVVFNELTDDVINLG